MDSKDLASIIENNSRIILPNFGAFLLKESSNNVFKPENITFSPFLKYNDGVLEEYYAKHKGIHKDEAIKQIKLFIDKIKETLNTEGTFIIENVGALSRNERGAIIFTPEGAKLQNVVSSIAKQATQKPKEVIAEQLPDDSSLNLELADSSEIVIDAEDEHPNETPRLEDNTLDIDIADDITPSTPTEIKEQNESNINQEIIVEKQVEEPDTMSKTKNKPKPKPKSKQKTKSKFKAILIYIGISFVIIIAFAFFIKYTAFNNSTQDSSKPIPINTNSTKSQEKTTETEDSTPKDEIDKAFDAMTPDENTKSPNTEENLEKVEEKIEQSVIENASIQNQVKTQFYLVVGSFKDKANAERYSKQLKAEGYNSEVIVQSSGLNSVTLGAYATKELASAEKKKLAKKYPSIWIIKK
ncbi:MAG: SPOR domain-containing protein [Bacteroidales bacterium]